MKLSLLEFTKRQKFIFCSIVLSFGLLAIQYVSIEYRYVAIFGFFLITYLVSSWALFDDLKEVEWFTLLSLPSLYACSIALFYFLLPDNLFSRVIITSLFGIGMYALYLTENIYSVAAVRTIQLLRAAHAIGFLLSILTLVLFYNTILSFQWPFYMTSVAVTLVTFPVLVQGLWSIQLLPKIPINIWIISLGLTLMIGIISILLSFLPVTVWIGALFLAALNYVCLGIMQHELNERLFQRTITEYVVVGLAVLVATLLVTPWK